MFTSDDRKNAIIGAVSVLGLLLTCMVSILLYKSVVAEQVDRSTVNITEDDYRKALARWQASGITEYELKLDRNQAEVTLRVTGGPNIQVISQSYRGAKVSDLEDIPEVTELQQFTVERLFDTVASSLHTVEAGASAGTNNPQGSYFYDYDIRFDPALGYPTYIMGYRRFTKPSREITWREIIEPAVEVKEFKAIK